MSIEKYKMSIEGNRRLTTGQALEGWAVRETHRHYPKSSKTHLSYCVPVHVAICTSSFLVLINDKTYISGNLAQAWWDTEMPGGGQLCKSGVSTTLCQELVLDWHSIPHEGNQGPSKTLLEYHTNEC